MFCRVQLEGIARVVVVQYQMHLQSMENHKWEIDVPNSEVVDP